MNVRGFIFDLDDTLFDARGAYAVAVETALAWLAPEKRAAVYAEARAFVKARLPARHVSARNRWLYFKRILEDTKGFSCPALIEVMGRYESALQKHIVEQWQRLGRAELLADLVARFPVAVITNENLRQQVLKLAAIDPHGNLFQHVLTSEEWGVEKPESHLLEAALARLNLPADAVAVVGNCLEDDIQPALRLGCRAVWTTEFEPGAGKAPSGVLALKKLGELVSHVTP